MLAIIGFWDKFLIQTQKVWDQIDLSDVDSGDECIQQLCQAMTDENSTVTDVAAGNCWVIHLPDSWQDFESQLSQSHRRQLRSLRKKHVDSQRQTFHRVTTPEKFERAWAILVELIRAGVKNVVMRRDLRRPNLTLSTVTLHSSFWRKTN